MHRILFSRAAPDGENCDGMRLLQLLAGVLVETTLLFDEPDEGLVASFRRLSDDLGCPPCGGLSGKGGMPSSAVIDGETEEGRAMARRLMEEEGLECPYVFHDLVIFFIHNAIVRMEMDGQARGETFNVFAALATRCLSYEIAAQELCDYVIENKVGSEGWSLGECVSGLSAVAGRFLALSANACEIFDTPALPDRLDQVAYVMMQEAVRLGIPAGTDWRFGLAANDCPANAPFDLVFSLLVPCREFFRAIGMDVYEDQAVSCAKAAGRMVAVAAGGEAPELESVIAKPLAMAAMTETYRAVCGDDSLAFAGAQ